MLIYVLAGLLSLGVASACALLARERGKNPAAWFVIGLVLNLVAFAVVAFQRKKGTP